MGLLTFTPKGIYCAQADVFIDPWRKVKRALVTHGHSDHASPGHSHYLCASSSVPVLRQRLGEISVDGLDYGRQLAINGVQFSFHPAGHVVGSAQIRVEYRGEVWVASGDYKVEDDGVSEPFEAVPCHTFITESTFGLPLYQWKPQAEIIREINAWWSMNKAEGKVSVIGAYSLGKAQRIIGNIDTSIGKIFCHPAVSKMNRAIRTCGIELPDTIEVKDSIDPGDYSGNLVVTPSTGSDAPWRQQVRNIELAGASGWMQLRKMRRSRSSGTGFVLSDHADWKGLNQAIEATGAERVYVTHGYTEIFSRWLKEKGYDARVVKTRFGTEDEEQNSH
ncbi:MAG: ligase-associated DNA damage response exonuclease [Bacteroidetes bacterium]|nr:ligase-associated DNA damage response exonuclease [Bacteroidota bacterium]